MMTTNSPLAILSILNGIWTRNKFSFACRRYQLKSSQLTKPFHFSACSVLVCWIWTCTPPIYCTTLQVSNIKIKRKTIEELMCTHSFTPETGLGVRRVDVMRCAKLKTKKKRWRARALCIHFTWINRKQNSLILSINNNFFAANKPSKLENAQRTDRRHSYESKITYFSTPFLCDF